MIDEKANRIYRKLSWYFEKQVPVHINSRYGFRNGLILDLSEVKKTLVIKDIVIGSSPMLLEDIYEDSIVEFRRRE